MPEQKCRNNATPVQRKACYHVENAFLSGLELVWPISSLKISKMSKKYVLAKRSRSQWFNHLSSSRGKKVIFKKWKKAGISEVSDGSKELALNFDPFEDLQ